MSTENPRQPKPDSLSFEFDIQLKSGVNLLKVPVIKGKKLSSHPGTMPEEPRRILPSEDVVVNHFKKFLQEINRQGGRIIQIVEKQYTINPDEAYYLNDARVESVQLIIVQKD